MTKCYQIFNDDNQPVKIFKCLSDAKNYINEIKKIYTTEAFYIVELSIVYST